MHLSHPPPRRAEIHLKPSKAAFVCQLARASVSLCNNTSFVHFIRLDVGLWEARPTCSAQQDLKYSPRPGTAATQTNGWVTDSTSRYLLELKTNKQTNHLYTTTADQVRCRKDDR